MAGRKISFDTTSREKQTIDKIVARYVADCAKHDIPVDKLSITMDVTATHANGNPLRLEDLLAADDFNFLHDLTGIQRFIDRSTGLLTGHFSPRFTRPQAA